jgi:hypothetical protein
VITRENSDELTLTRDLSCCLDYTWYLDHKERLELEIRITYSDVSIAHLYYHDVVRTGVSTMVGQ